MDEYIWLIPALPLMGFLINGLLGRKLPEMAVSVIACAGPIGAFAVSVLVFGKVSDTGNPITQSLFTWISLEGEQALRFGLMVDNLTSVMILVVTGVGSLIHVYSIGYMHGDKSYARYFAYLNLFTFAMLVLVMGDSLAALFVGWEGVGLCSYLLIGFWFEDPHNSDAGKKAFIVNRIGDLGFLLGMFTLFALAGSLDFETLSKSIPQGDVTTGLFAGWQVVSVLELAALFLFVGAAGKSAQIPLYVWLPDAMAGPTPVSALIHAATMVTAGVYMIGRLHYVFEPAFAAMEWIALIGGATALFAAIIAVAQNDIKKVLAYSTISQLGYMFVGMASAQFGTGVFHLVTHAFFKALLFLGAGAVIHMMGGEQDIRKMGGIAKKNRLLFVVFGVGWLALSGLYPLAGYWSKDSILLALFNRHDFLASGALMMTWAMLLVAAGLTAFYMTRLVVIAFFGEPKSEPEHGHAPGPTMMVPLVVLAGLSLIGGGFGIPEYVDPPATETQISGWVADLAVEERQFEATKHLMALGHHGLEHLDTIAAPKSPAAGIAHRLHYNHYLMIALSQASAGLGLLFGLWLYGLKRRELGQVFARSAPARKVREIVQNKFYVDELYEYTIVIPLKMAATGIWFIVDRIIIDTIFVNGIGKLVYWTACGFRRAHTGRLSVATAGILAGAAAMVAILVLKFVFRG